MTIVRVGSNQKFSDGWDKAFGKGTAGKSAATSAAQGKKPAADAKKKTAKPAKKAAKKKK